MKKLIVILAIVAIASPVMAAVTVTATRVGTSNDWDITYVNADVNKVRAFALDFSMAGGATVTNTVCSNSSYYIYPGSIQISGGSVQSYGSCVCTAGFGGALASSAGGVTIEMGSLYASGGATPASSGTLARVTFSGCTATPTLAVNTARGGVVKENPDEASTVTLVVSGVCAGQIDCYPSTYSKYSDWKSAGKPNCWCGTNTNGMTGTPVLWKFQCYGDADNGTETLSKYRIYNNDYAKLVSNWKKKITETSFDRCADFDHGSETLSKYRVYNNDYARLVSNWKKKDSQFTGSGNCPVMNP